MKIKNVKGSYDFLPNEQKVRNYLNDTIINNFKKYGFKNIETPILCYYDMLSDKYDENNDLLNEIYRLTDRGERSLGLRYDLTVPFAKFIALNKNKITIPFKRFEIAKTFRDGPVKPGRDREFTQCDGDVVGLDGQLIEAELLTIFVKTFKELDIDIIIKYNSRKLMNGLITEAGIDKAILQEVTTIIDKKDKLNEDEFESLLLDLDIDKLRINKLNEYFKLDLYSVNAMFKDSSNALIRDGLNEINSLSGYIKDLGITSAIFDITLARGQNYYTGNIFEVFDKKQRIKSSIAAGGRYDKMITNFINDGNSYPAVGISFGISAIYELIKDKFNDEKDSDFFIIPLDNNTQSLKVANKLRDLGFSVDVDLTNRKLKKSLDYANKQNIEYVIILGEDEISNNVVNIKNMKNGKTIKVSMSKLNDIKEILNITN